MPRYGPRFSLPSINVKSFGAKGDGRSNDTGAFARTVKEVVAMSYAIDVPPGTFRVGQSGGVVLPSTIGSLLIRGSGPSSLLKLPDDTPSSGGQIFNSSLDDVIFENLAFDANDIANAVCVRITTSGKRVMFRNCWFFDPGSGGVHLMGACTDVSVEGCVFSGSRYGILTADSATFERLAITGNQFIGTSDGGDAVEINVPDSGAKRIIISNNTITGYTAAANAGFGIGISGGSQLVITGNHIYNCREAIHIEHGANATVGSKQAVVANNIIDTCSRSGISILAATSGKSVENVTVQGNQIYNCTAAGIAVEGSGDKNNVIITSNLVEAGGASGITASPGGASMKNLQIVGNICRNNTGPGIIVGGTGTNDNLLVQANRCYDDQETKTQTYGLELRGAHSLLRVYDNDFSDNDTDGLLLTDVTGTVKYRDNEGFTEPT